MPRFKCKHKRKKKLDFIHMNGKMPVEHLTNGIHDTSTSLPPDFKAFKFIPKLIGDKNDSLNACLRMFEDLDIVEQFRPKTSTLRKFLQTVQKNYKQLPYHNWEHAFAVAHFCYLLLRTPKLKTQLNDLERLSLLVSSICHDLDHPGTSNSFQIQYKTPLADLYNNEGSILEKHHFAQTISILKSKECDIFEELSKEDFQHVMDILQDTIMATDIAVHFSSTMPRLKKTTEEGFDLENPSHRTLVMCLIITASDISEQGKIFSHAKFVAANLYREFFLQGDVEKTMGGQPIEMMDRERGFIPKFQVDFMDNATIPTFKFLMELIPEVHEIFPVLKFNRNCWAALEKIMHEDGFSSIYGNLDVLEDKKIEGKILTLVETMNVDKI